MRFFTKIIILVVLISIGGCTKVPVVILCNNTSSDIELISGSKAKSLKSQCSCELNGDRVFVSETNAFDLIVNQNQSRHGYQFSLEDFLKVKTVGARPFKFIYYLTIENDGYIYLANPNEAKIRLAKQPEGFPIKPKLLNPKESQS